MLKLMVLEDEPGESETLEQIAKSLVYVDWLGCFSKPLDALKEAVRNTPDVVIAAVELADMNGLTFTARLQELLPSVRVIVSARNGNYARAAYEAGARGYLIKPVGKESFMRVLDHARAQKS